MAIFKGEKVEAVLFSPLEGTLLYRGEPAAGATLKRWVAWKDERGEVDTFIADDNGRFELPEKTARYRDDPLAQISIGQSVTVEYGGESFKIWDAGKSTTDLYGELGGRPIGLKCEITRREVDHHVDIGLVSTICQWDRLETWDS
ncbi:DUF6795 domain-containing protein [Gilvimarinus sp. F26214L]|uniref:DUF6795 domain-containing protein n=1 Tax=Gilvimarinus sp. DZF01 TaxID=3461371 RepID=UPI0040465549